MIAAALRPGGGNLLQLPNVLYAEKHLPQKTWIAGEGMVELIDHRWEPRTRYLEGSTTPILVGETFEGVTPIPFRQRLYSVEELTEIYGSVGMELAASSAAPASRGRRRTASSRSSSRAASPLSRPYQSPFSQRISSGMRPRRSGCAEASSVLASWIALPSASVALGGARAASRLQPFKRPCDPRAAPTALPGLLWVLLGDLDDPHHRLVHLVTGGRIGGRLDHLAHESVVQSTVEDCGEFSTLCHWDLPLRVCLPPVLASAPRTSVQISV